MDDKKKLMIVMGCTIEYANRESLKYDSVKDKEKEIPMEVHFINWVNSFELDMREKYIILKDKGNGI